MWGLSSGDLSFLIFMVIIGIVIMVFTIASVIETIAITKIKANTARRVKSKPKTETVGFDYDTDQAVSLTKEVEEEKN